MARPSKFKPEYASQAEKLCKLGATDADIAEFFGLNVATIYRWKHDYPEFCEALKRGKEIADNLVEQRLFQRATGYSHDDVHVSNYQGEIKLTPLVKHYPPDTVACIFWLKNRKPEQWRDKQDHEHSGEVAVRDAGSLPFDQIRQRAEEQVKH